MGIGAKVTHLLVLGGTGFLGRLIADRARSEGFRVSVSGRREVHRHDIEKIDFKFQDGKLVAASAPDVDVIVNALACYGNSGTGENEMLWVNRDFPFEVMEHYAKKSKPPVLFLNVDSALRNEVSPYAKSKGELRARLVELAAAGSPVVGLRLEQFYGPGDGPGKFMTMLVSKFLSKAPSIPLSTGTQERRFLYVTDAIGAIFEIVALARSKKLHYSAASAALLPALGEKTSVRDLVLRVQKLCGGEATRLEFGARPDRGVETDARAVPEGYEFLEAQKILSLEQGIPRVVDFERSKR